MFLIVGKSHSKIFIFHFIIGFSSLILLNLQIKSVIMGKIYEFTPSYMLAKGYILFGFKRFYREFIVTGRENLPVDGSPVIFAPNHLNALMDALAISTLVPRTKAVIYLARADLFTHKTTAKIMHMAKIMPAFRMRDGFENLEKNNRVFYQCVDVLRFNHSLCIMPEGGQGDERKIRPLAKGIFRVAFEAQQQFGEAKKVKIIPVGINPGDLQKSGKHIIINIGKPIEITDYISEYLLNPVGATNEIRDELKNRLSDLTLDLATAKYYKSFETISEIVSHEYIEPDKKAKNTLEEFKLKQETTRKLIRIENDDPDKMKDLHRLAGTYNRIIGKLKFESGIFNQQKRYIPTLGLFLKLLVGLPVFLFGLFTNFLPALLPVFIRKLLKVNYPGFYTSVDFGLGLITFPVFYVFQTVAVASIFHLSWWIILIFIALQYFTRPFAVKWYSRTRKFIARLRFDGLLVQRSHASNLLYRAISIRNKIIYKLNNP